MKKYILILLILPFIFFIGINKINANPIIDLDYNNPEIQYLANIPGLNEIISTLEALPNNFSWAVTSNIVNYGDNIFLPRLEIVVVTGTNLTIHLPLNGTYQSNIRTTHNPHQILNTSGINHYRIERDLVTGGFRQTGNGSVSNFQNILQNWNTHSSVVTRTTQSQANIGEFYINCHAQAPCPNPNNRKMGYSISDRPANRIDSHSSVVLASRNLFIPNNPSTAFRVGDTVYTSGDLFPTFLNYMKNRPYIYDEIIEVGNLSRIIVEFIPQSGHSIFEFNYSTTRVGGCISRPFLQFAFLNRSVENHYFENDNIAPCQFGWVEEFEYIWGDPTSLDINFIIPLDNLNDGTIRLQFNSSHNFNIRFEYMNDLTPHLKTINTTGYDVLVLMPRVRQNENLIDLSSTIFFNNNNSFQMVIYEDNSRNSREFFRTNILQSFYHFNFNSFFPEQVIYLFNQHLNEPNSVTFDSRFFNYALLSTVYDTTTITNPNTGQEVEVGNVDWVNPMIFNCNSAFCRFTTDTHGLMAIITAPLGLISRVANATCTPLNVPLPFINRNLSLPCMTIIYQQNFGAFLTLYQVITFGVVAYWVSVRVLKHFKDIKDPTNDKIEVMDL